MWECEWDKIYKTDVGVRGQVDSYSLADVLNPHDVLYGGRFDQSTDRSVIKYVDVHSHYHDDWKSKHYPVCHPRCLIGCERLRRIDKLYGSTTEGSTHSSLTLSH